MKASFRLALSTLALIVILAIVHLYINTKNISLKYQTTDLKIHLNELKSQRRLLESRVAKSQSPALVEKIAKEKLNMTYPSKMHYIGSQSGKTSSESDKK